MITREELAKALGVSRATISKDEKRGMPIDDVTRARRWRKKHLQPGRMKGVRRDTVPDAENFAPSPAAATADIDELCDDIDPEDADIRSYKGARERREHYQAELARMAYERECGQLMPVLEATRMMAEAGTFIRLSLEAMPQRLAPSLAHITEEHRIERLLAQEVFNMLTGMSQKFDRLADGKDDTRQTEIL